MSGQNTGSNFRLEYILFGKAFLSCCYHTDDEKCSRKKSVLEGRQQMKKGRATAEVKGSREMVTSRSGQFNGTLETCILYLLWFYAVREFETQNLAPIHLFTPSSQFGTICRSVELS